MGRRATREAHFSDDGSLCGQETADPPGSLGAKLQELGKKLLLVSFHRCQQLVLPEWVRSSPAGQQAAALMAVALHKPSGKLLHINIVNSSLDLLGMNL